MNFTIKRIAAASLVCILLIGMIACSEKNTPDNLSGGSSVSLSNYSSNSGW